MSARSSASGNASSAGLFDYLEAVVADLPLEIDQSGGLITVRVSCSSPLRLRLEPVDGQVFAYFLCRSTSWDWPGERTDVHDLFSVYLAARLAAVGLASCSLIDESNPAVHIPGELYSRYIIPTQPRRGWYSDDAEGRAELAALIGTLSDVEAELHRLGGPCNESEEMEYSADDEGLNGWAADVSAALDRGGDDAQDEPVLAARANPDWKYYRSADGERSVAGSWGLAALFVRFPRGEPDEKRGEKARLVRRGMLQNVMKDDDLSYAREVLADLLSREPVDVLAVPLEDCLVAVSDAYMCALRADTGKDAYTRELEATLKKHDSFLSWTQRNASFQWSKPVDPRRFEQLAYELLSAEPDVQRVRFVGSTNNPDGGRDLLVDMMAPLTRQEIEAGGASGDGPLLTPRRVLIQCKTKGDPTKAVGKADVRDIRDTIDRYEADGYWLFASSHITAQLVEHLEVLKRKYPHVDWWTRREIEEALRRSPRLIDSHRDVVTRE